MMLGQGLQVTVAYKMKASGRLPNPVEVTYLPVPSSTEDAQWRF